MYLKRLEIKGFKSFSQKTVLDFLPSKNGRNSMTAVVGPNGSGKSNIVDAIRWVMGEQSLKQLRGKKSEDIIFHGSQTKGKLSAAEVILVLDNSDAKILTDYPEINITRRLYRSGESEYLINNNAVRLLDIHLLLAKAQFAQHSYSIVGQGMIDRLLMVSPNERKDFLDEASGIKEFKIKQHQAKLKLARSTENVVQAENLLKEVEPRLRILSRQVKKLQKRQEVEIQLRSNQEIYYSTIYNTNQKELDKIKIELTDIEKTYHTVFNELTAVQEELAELARQSSRQQVFEQLQTKHGLLVKTKNDLERQLAVMGGQMQTEYSKAGQQNIGWIENKINQLKNKTEELSSKIKTWQQETDKIQSLLLVKRQAQEELEAQINRYKLDISRLEKQVFQNQAEHNLQQYTGLLAVQAVVANSQNFGKVYGPLAELGQVEDEYKIALEVSAGSFLTALVVEDSSVAKNAIEYLRQHRLGFATFLPLNKVNGFSGYDIPAEILQQAGVVGLAIDLVKYSTKFDDIFSFVFKNTLIVEDLATARAVGIGKYRMVTLDGDIAERSGVMKGGYRQTRKNGLGFSQKMMIGSGGVAELKIEINRKKQELVELEQELVKLVKIVSEHQTKKESNSTKIEMLNAEQNEILQEVASLKQELKLLNADPTTHSELLVTLNKDKQDLNEKIKIKDKAIEQMADKIQKFNNEEEKKKQKVFALQDEMQTKQNLVNQTILSRNESKVSIARLETKQESIFEEVQAQMNMDVKNILERIDIDKIEEPIILEELNAKIQKLKYQLSLIGGIDEEVIEEHEQTKIKYDFLFNQITDLNKAMIDLEKMIVELDKIMKTKRQVAFKKIRKEFIRYVKILFGGGEADMKEIFGYEDQEEDEDEVEPTDLEEETKKSRRQKIVTGIDIMVNPPGKKIKNINTLSGGERTLSSIALICAVLNYNPAPFVVLDEVEAALDETNTRRFAKIISELATQSQFIIITHNRVTMHSVDVLYGVTMGADGMSKLLSVKLEDVVVSN